MRRGPLDRPLAFPYHPHVTVAHDVEPEWLDQAHSALASYRAAFEEDRLGLFVLGPGGVWRHTVDLPFGADVHDPGRYAGDSVTIGVLDPEEFPDLCDRLGGIVADAVASGAGVNFLLPFSASDGAGWWRAQSADVAAGRRVLLVARDAGEVVGTISLNPAQAPNQPHRAELSKLLVRSSDRRRGVASRLMEAAAIEARGRGFTLLTLDCVAGGPEEEFYRGLGYVPVGTIPGYCPVSHRGAAGRHLPVPRAALAAPWRPSRAPCARLPRHAGLLRGERALKRDRGRSVTAGRTAPAAGRATRSRWSRRRAGCRRRTCRAGPPSSTRAGHGSAALRRSRASRSRGAAVLDCATTTRLPNLRPRTTAGSTTTATRSNVARTPATYRRAYSRGLASAMLATSVPPGPSTRRACPNASSVVTSPGVRARCEDVEDDQVRRVVRQGVECRACGGDATRIRNSRGQGRCARTMSTRRAVVLDDQVAGAVGGWQLAYRASAMAPPPRCTTRSGPGGSRSITWPIRRMYSNSSRLGVGQVHVGLLRPVDEQDPAVGPVRVGEQGRLAAGDRPGRPCPEPPGVPCRHIVHAGARRHLRAVGACGIRAAAGVVAPVAGYQRVTPRTSRRGTSTWQA